MATTAPRLTGEPRLFVGIALSQLCVALIGFGLEPFRGRTDYAALPLTVYIHAALGLSWCVIAVMQPWLIAARRPDLHRTIGWIAAGLAVALIATGTWTAFNAVAAGRGGPPAFALAINVGGLVPFGLLVASAIQVRRRTDWHRRLLACATIVAVAPAWARILPMGSLGPVGLLAMEALMLAPVAYGALYDRRARRRVHPAWWWGGAAILSALLTLPVALMPGFAAWANQFGPNG